MNVVVYTPFTDYEIGSKLFKADIFFDLDDYLCDEKKVDGNLIFNEFSCIKSFELIGGKEKANFQKQIEKYYKPETENGK